MTDKESRALELLKLRDKKNRLINKIAHTLLEQCASEGLSISDLERIFKTAIRDAKWEPITHVNEDSN